MLFGSVLLSLWNVWELCRDEVEKRPSLPFYYLCSTGNPTLMDVHTLCTEDELARLDAQESGRLSITVLEALLRTSANAASLATNSYFEAAIQIA